jgi:signal peptidase I
VPGEPAAEEPATDGEQAGGQRRKSWRQLMMVVLAAIVLMLLIKAFVVQVYRIPSSSMEDTLLTGDRVLVNKLVYHTRGIARGDIVVFSGDGSWGSTTGAPDPSPPGNPLLRAGYDVLADIGVYSTQTYYIKRVIGLPGDHVVCCANGKVTVNGVPLDERSYLFPGARPSMQPFHVTVPAGRLWVMGDNRAISDDSREHMSSGSPGLGTVPESKVAGRAFVIIWPPSQIGDLPIPATFQQAALRAGAAAAPALPAAGAAVLAAIPMLASRRILTPPPRYRLREDPVRRAATIRSDCPRDRRPSRTGRHPPCPAFRRLRPLPWRATARASHPGRGPGS